MVSLCVSLYFELLHAAGNGDVAAVNRLIEAGKDVNEKDTVSASPPSYIQYRIAVHI